MCKPGFYLDGDESIKRLLSFLVGYESGLIAGGGNLHEFGDLRDFGAWVAKQLGFFESTSGWCNMILSAAGSDAKAFILFFDLLDRYRKVSNR